jgi:hypothetical protein
MDCIGLIDTERLQLDGRPVSISFHFAIIEQALLYISGALKEPAAPATVGEMQAACDEALEALAELRTASLTFP